MLDFSSIDYDLCRIIPKLVHLRYVAANIEESTDHNSSYFRKERLGPPTRDLENVRYKTFGYWMVNTYA